jgi:hypothetical protein
MLISDRGYDADWIGALAVSAALGPISRRNETLASRSTSAPTSHFYNKIGHQRKWLAYDE